MKYISMALLQTGRLWSLHHRKIQSKFLFSCHMSRVKFSSEPVSLLSSFAYHRHLILRSSLLNYMPQRCIRTSSALNHGEYEYQDPKSEDEVVYVTFLNKDGQAQKIRGKVGDNILYLAKRFEVDVEGACEASLACTTCHVYVDDEFMEKFPEASETEEDLLDQAPFLKENSRLGCQLILQKEHDGLKLGLPAATKNFYVDGHKPSHH